MARHYLKDASDGPWTRTLGLYTGWEVMASNGHIIARVIENTHARANANLITSAPELLSALEAMTKAYVELVEADYPQSWDVEKDAEVVSARAIISKAKGQP